MDNLTNLALSEQNALQKLMINATRLDNAQAQVEVESNMSILA
jgi:hypothetical protein